LTIGPRRRCRSRASALSATRRAHFDGRFAHVDAVANNGGAIANDTHRTRARRWNGGCNPRPAVPKEAPMARVRPFVALAALAVALGVTSLAHATVVVPLSLADQVAQADLVVRARVGSMQSAFVPERGAILTWTELSVSETLKGQAPSTLVLRQMGGTADGQTMLVPGDAHLATGDDVILFLRRDPGGTDNVLLVGMAQSAWYVHGQQAARDLSQLTFAVLGDEGMQLSDPGREVSVRVDALEADIRRLATTGGAR
jgi:hypothetical protein